MSVTREQFARAFLPLVGAPVTDHNLWALVAWMQAEGSDARFNPLATTQEWSGASDFNWIGVKNYATLADGLAATAKTLNFGADHDQFGYRPIRHRLRKDAWARRTLLAVEASDWGTGGLALACLPWVKRSWDFYRNKPIAS